MIKLFKLPLLLSIALLWVLSAHSQTPRPAHWIHGLNSSQNFWAQYRTTFEAARRFNNLTSSNPNYNTTNGVNNFAGQVNTATNPNANTQGMAIGHSMGGTAARQASRTASNFGGMIVCGSPLNGAPVLNSIANGTMESTILNGVDEISKGPTAMNGIPVFMITGIPPGPIASIAIAKKLRQVIRNQVAGDPDIPINTANANNFYGAQTFTDLQQNSAYMNGINSATGTLLQRLVIWGNENSPIHWRLLSSMDKANDGVAWSSDDDKKFVDYANAAITQYHAQYLHQMSIAATNNAFGNFPAGIYHTWIANQWKAGHDWLNQSESLWASLIGATTTTVQSGFITTYVDICNSEQWAQCYQNNSPAYCMVVCQTPVQEPYFVTVQAGSDGLVPIYSQQGLGTNWSVGADRLLQAVSVNHMEMRGHSNMSTQFNTAFDRGDFFGTPPW